MTSKILTRNRTEKLFDVVYYFGTESLNGRTGMRISSSNCPDSELVARIKLHKFRIERQGATNPAVMTALGPEGIMCRGRRMLQCQSAIVRHLDVIRMDVADVMLCQFSDKRRLDLKGVPRSISGSFFIDRAIGIGGQGCVRLVHHFVNQGRFAKKILPKMRFKHESVYQHTNRLNHMKQWVASKNFLVANSFPSFSFVPQVDTMKKLNHPNFVRFLKSRCDPEAQRCANLT